MVGEGKVLRDRQRAHSPREVDTFFRQPERYDLGEPLFGPNRGEVTPRWLARNSYRGR
jgi:hypothetical protein